LTLSAKAAVETKVVAAKTAAAVVISVRLFKMSLLDLRGLHSHQGHSAGAAPALHRQNVYFLSARQPYPWLRRQPACNVSATRTVRARDRTLCPVPTISPR
jgi:hypothetical protein